MSTPAAKSFAWYFYPLRWLLLALAHLPLGVLYGVAEAGYFLLAYVVRYRWKLVLDNLGRSFPEKTDAERQRIGRSFYRHFAQVLVETLKLESLDPAELCRRVRIQHPELIARHFEAGRTVLALGSHAGNWEWILPRGAVEYPGRVYGVYKPLSNLFFESFLLGLRTHTGSVLVPMRDTLRDLVRRRNEGRVLSLLTDQAAGPEDRPYWTTFLNQDTSFYTGAERMAAQFNCPVVYVNCRRVRRGYYELTITELHDGQTTLPAGSNLLTEAFARQLERDVQAAPAEYLWTHRRWKHKR
ncbi:lysophospholipid acyltransferase family protein [Hymenobacter sp. BT175]|uniref:lysophospholipid acyltransferase family protein n=1 Tax=Hymenobacter translucens TaxID=2886507 RepID=UPI001D0E3410|nr:lysophospholipid acyltransferase family protein [Hymenobacter translucens]MCC2547816.1 lysophospholipid acyltransferase family protein [Hymenobacter translucens]